MNDRQYELVYILPPETTEQQSGELHEQIASIVSRLNGQIEKTENWGRRKLAYEIGHFKEGVYVLEVINGSGELMKELDRRLKVIDEVVRHLIVRVDEEKKVVDRTRTKRQTESERRRVKRGLPPQRQLAWQQVVARVAVGDLYHLAAASEVVDMLSQNHFHGALRIAECGLGIGDRNPRAEFRGPAIRDPHCRDSF